MTMKLPDLKTKLPKLSRSRGPSRGATPKVPKFATDLYADLRDRRLLPLVALLAIAIVAVPVVLAGRSDEGAGPPPAPIAGASSVSPASFSVVPATTSLRDYHRRLGYREARNPFDRPQEGSSSSAAATEEGAESSSGSEGTSQESGEAEVSEPPSSESSSSGSGETSTPTHVVVENQVIGYEIDAKAGFVSSGPVGAHKGISPMTRLPSKKNPLVLFVGPSNDKKTALFLMTENVTAFYGHGTCVLKQATSCQLLALKPGQSATFADGYGEARYKLYLKKIVAVEGTREAAATITTGK